MRDQVPLWILFTLIGFSIGVVVQDNGALRFFEDVLSTTWFNVLISLLVGFYIALVTYRYQQFKSDQERIIDSIREAFRYRYHANLSTGKTYYILETKKIERLGILQVLSYTHRAWLRKGYSSQAAQLGTVASCKILRIRANAGDFASFNRVGFRRWGSFEKWVESYVEQALDIGVPHSILLPWPLPSIKVEFRTIDEFF